MEASRIYANSWSDYELIDAGGGKKLERFGKIITIRPEVQAYFRSGKDFSEWEKIAHWEFISKSGQTGNWKRLKKDTPDEWRMGYQDFTFQLRLTKFKHIGIFPEQSVNWGFIKENLSDQSKFLNLFAYTGAASVAGKSTDAEVLHVDSVKQLIGWAKENMELSGQENIKWVHEDALKFAAREVKRGRHYDGIIMDPPAWGIGAKKEKWKLEDKLDELLENARQLIGSKGFLVLNTYSPKVSIDLMTELATKHFSKRSFQVSEIWMKTSTGKELYYGNLLRISSEH